MSDNADVSISGNIEINGTPNDDRSDYVERTIQSAIMDGDFSSMTNAEPREIVEENYQHWEENGTIEKMDGSREKFLQHHQEWIEAHPLEVSRNH